MEFAIADVQERYRTLRLHGIEGVDATEMARADALLSSWQSTIDAALTRDVRLVKVKAQFTAVTKQDVATFSASADELRTAYHATGPTSLGIGLTQGLAMMAEFNKRLAQAYKEREALMNAERLFGLPMTRYPQLQEVQDDIDHVAPLYTLYSDLTAFAETNSNMLWADLDINALQKGAEDLSKRLLRLKDLKGTSVYNAVSDEVTGFRESLPLIASLKNPAMKERHWDKISALTGVKIAANNPKAFTLGASEWRGENNGDCQCASSLRSLFSLPLFRSLRDEPCQVHGAGRRDCQRGEAGVSRRRQMSPQHPKLTSRLAPTPAGSRSSATSVLSRTSGLRPPSASPSTSRTGSSAGALAAQPLV